MQLQLSENGLDSLKAGITFYSKYLHSEMYGEEEPDLWFNHLKIAVICIHNTIEIFTKKSLTDVNELLIYKDISDPKLLETIKLNREGEEEIPLHYALINNETDILTISYTECIKRMNHLFDLTITELQDLYELGKVRNKILHFGLSKPDYYKILGLVNRLLLFVIDFFYEEIEEAGTDTTQSVIDEVKYAIKIGDSLEQKAWGDFFRPKLRILEGLLSSSCHKVHYTDLQPDALVTSLHKLNRHESPYVVIEMHTLDGRAYQVHRSVNIPRLDASIITNDDENLVFGVIDHLKTTNPFYIYRTPKEASALRASITKFWESDKKCVRSSLDEPSVDILVSTLIKSLMDQYRLAGEKGND